jgi:hypothetical protein
MTDWLARQVAAGWPLAMNVNCAILATAALLCAAAGRTLKVTKSGSI